MTGGSTDKLHSFIQPRLSSYHQAYITHLFAHRQFLIRKNRVFAAHTAVTAPNIPQITSKRLISRGSLSCITPHNPAVTFPVTVYVHRKNKTHKSPFRNVCAQLSHSFRLTELSEPSPMNCRIVPFALAVKNTNKDLPSKRWVLMKRGHVNHKHRAAQIFQTSRSHLKNNRRHKDDMKQVTYRGATNIRHHHTRFDSHGDLASLIYTPLCSVYIYLTATVTWHQ
jgi:hypothetical protein